MLFHISFFFFWFEVNHSDIFQAPGNKSDTDYTGARSKKNRQCLCLYPPELGDISFSNKGTRHPRDCCSSVRCISTSVLIRVPLIPACSPPCVGRTLGKMKSSAVLRAFSSTKGLLSAIIKKKRFPSVLRTGSFPLNNGYEC